MKLVDFESQFLLIIDQVGFKFRDSVVLGFPFALRCLPHGNAPLDHRRSFASDRGPTQRFSRQAMVSFKL